MKLPQKASKKAVGKRLKAWRKEQGLTLTNIADDVGVSQGSLSDIENGNSHPGYSTLYKLIHTYKDHDMTWIIFLK